MIRPKFRICKRYETDVWAELVEKRKKTNLAKSILIKNKFLLRKQSAFYFFFIKKNKKLFKKPIEFSGSYQGGLQRIIKRIIFKIAGKRRYISRMKLRRAKYFKKKVNRKFLKSRIGGKRKRTFIYRLDTRKPRKRRRKLTFFGIQYGFYLQLRSFYQMDYKKFKRIVKRNNKIKNKGGEYMAQLEYRLDIITYRLYMADTILEARNKVRNGEVLVNFVARKYRFDGIRVGEILTFLDPNSSKIFRNKILLKLKTARLFHNFPKYYEINYIYGFIIPISLPEVNEIPYPSKLDPLNGYLFSKFL